MKRAWKAIKRAYRRQIERDERAYGRDPRAVLAAICHTYSRSVN